MMKKKNKKKRRMRWKKISIKGCTVKHVRIVSP